LKRLAGLVIVIALVLGLVVGCGGETVSGDVSVGPMTVSLIGNWQRPDNYEDLLSSVLDESNAAWVAVDAYKGKSGDILIFIESFDMVAYYELQGQSWQGWDTELEVAGITKEDYVDYVQSGLIDESMEMTLLARQQLTIGGHESWESNLIADDGEDISRICLLVIFAPDSLGIVQLITDEADWAQFEDTWETIRDSVTI
jgi:hypothetical protein